VKDSWAQSGTEKAPSPLDGTASRHEVQKEVGRVPSTANEILSRCRISEVYQALTGIEPRRTGRDSWRASAPWRGGDGKASVSGDDSRGVFHDFVTDEGGGLLDLVGLIRGCSRQDALKWLAEFVGVPLDDAPLSAAVRVQWVAEKQRCERALPDARYWRRAAIDMSEELLTTLKAALFDGPSEKVDFDGIRDTTLQLARLRRIDGAELVAEFRRWMENDPRLTCAMVQAARTRETSERRAVQAYLGMGLPAEVAGA
jgi:hypothetical protein